MNKFLFTLNSVYKWITFFFKFFLLSSYLVQLMQSFCLFLQAFQFSQPIDVEEATGQQGTNRNTGTTPQPTTCKIFVCLLC